MGEKVTTDRFGNQLDPEALALMVARGDGMTFAERKRAAELIRSSSLGPTQLPPSDGLEMVPAIPTTEMINALAPYLKDWHGRPMDYERAAEAYGKLLRASLSATRGE